MQLKLKLLALILSMFQVLVARSQEIQKPVTIQVDAAKSIGKMRPFWSYFGYDEPNYTTRKNGEKLLK